MLEKITLKFLLLVAVLSDFWILLSSDDKIILLFYINVVAVEQESTEAACLHNLEYFLFHLLTFFLRNFVWTIIAFYTHPLLVEGLFFAVSQVHRLTPSIIVHHLCPLVKQSMRIVWQLKQVLKPFHVFIQGAKGKKQAPSITLFLQRN